MTRRAAVARACSAAWAAPSRSPRCSAACRCSTTWRSAIAERSGRRDGACGARLRAPGRSSRRAAALLAALGIADDAATRVADLPYGKQRLVEIAIALGLKPKVLLLDEPAAGVPSAESKRILADPGEAAGRHRHPDHRARHGPRVPLRAAHHRAGAGRGAGRRHAGGDRARQARARRLPRREQHG